MHKTRRHDDSGPVRIGYRDLKDWQDVTGQKINRETAELLMDMETQFQNTNNEERLFIRAQIEAARDKG